MANRVADELRKLAAKYEKSAKEGLETAERMEMDAKKYREQADDNLGFAHQCKAAAQLIEQR